MHEFNGLLLLPRLKVHNANALPGPLSWGFPAPTAFLGFAHALQRKLKGNWDATFTGVGIVCHHFDPQAEGRYQKTFRLARHPIRAGYKKFQDKDAAIVEEGRAHMEVSLLLETQGYLEDDKEDFCEDVLEIVHGMRLAGGSIQPAFGEPHKPQWRTWWDDDQENQRNFRKLARRLPPGFALVDCSDLLATHLEQLRAENPETDALDALLDLSALHATCETDEGGTVHWQARRRRPGWLVPLPVGYAGLSALHPPGTVANARDTDTPFRFVESLYGLGQWISPHRIPHPDALMWRYTTQAEDGLYLCRNQYAQYTRHLN